VDAGGLLISLNTGEYSRKVTLPLLAVEAQARGNGSFGSTDLIG